MRSFKKFCESIVDDAHIEISDAMFISPEYVKSIESLITIIKPKLDIIDKVQIKFIENAFDDIDVEQVLSDKTDGDIPDAIMNVLSNGLYGKMFNCINSEEQIIIKTLSVYLIIQNLI